MLQPIVHENNPVDWIVNITYGGNSYQVEMANNPEDIEIYQITDGINSIEVKPCCNLFDVLKNSALRWYKNNMK